MQPVFGSPTFLVIVSSGTILVSAIDCKQSFSGPALAHLISSSNAAGNCQNVTQGQKHPVRPPASGPSTVSRSALLKSHVPRFMSAEVAKRGVNPLYL